MVKIKKTRKTIKRSNNHSSKTKKNTSFQFTDTNTGLIDRVKLGKQLGKGMMGTTYLATDKDGNKYAYKIERILPRETRKNLNSTFWREVDFGVNLANKYPDLFMSLYDWKIINKCEHKQDFSGFDFKMEDLPKEQQNYYKRVNASPYCSIKLWSLIDGVLHDMVEPQLKFSKKVFYDIYIQILNIIYVMNKEGYFHNDLHPGNIGYIKTDKKFINIMGKDIPTHGYILKAIDFGLVLHDKYPLTPSWREKYENDNDLFPVFNLLSIELKTDKLNGNYTWKWFNEWLETSNKLHIPKKYIEKLEKYLPEGHSLNKDNYKWFMNKLFKMLEYEEWQRIITKNKTLQGIKPSYNIPETHLLYLVKHIYEPEKVLKYFLNNRI